METSSIFKFIVTPENGEVYKNKINVNGKELILNTHTGLNDKDLLQLQGNVIHSPLYNNLSINEGDRVLVQHNTFRVTTNMDGEYEYGSILEDGQYFVTYDLIYAYHNGEEWLSTNNWIFLKPEIYKSKGVLEAQKTLRPDRGIVAFSQDPNFIDESLQVGDTIIFRTGKRVTCKVDGETYLRVRTKDILINYDR